MEVVVGRNIRALRQARHLTVESLADACGVTKGQMSKIETGNVSSPLSTIDRIAQVLEIDTGQLLRRADGSNWHVMRKAQLEERRTRLKGAHHHYEKLFAGSSFDSTFQPMHGRLATAAQLNLYRYPGPVLVIITRGKVIYEYSGERISLGVGDIFYCDGREEHGPVEIVDGPVDYLLVMGNLRT
jgi:transcriptional regulator with XRE-family HTH domain